MLTARLIDNDFAYNLHLGKRIGTKDGHSFVIGFSHPIVYHYVKHSVAKSWQCDSFWRPSLFPEDILVFFMNKIYITKDIGTIFGMISKKIAIDLIES